MLSFSKVDTARTKCKFTHTSLPAAISAQQPPSKKLPFSSIAAQPYNHAVHLILPAELSELISRSLDDEEFLLTYSRVYMSLGEVIIGDFFDKCVKTGNVLMLSEGRAGVDNVFRLRNGLLTLELDKPTYERVGLAGKPFPGGGQKHKKARYLIEINLRLPSMVPGKKAFNRVEWAFKRVLNHSLAWLFYDADQPSVNNENAEESPILKHHPFIETVKPTVERIRNAQIPKFIPSEGLEDQEYIAEIHEWLGLAFVNSPRISKDDIIDSYLSRYHPPIAQDADGKDIPLNVEDIVSVKWQGLIPSAFVEKLYMTVRKPAKDRWFALNASGFEEQGYSVINQGSEVLTWQWPAG